METITFAADPFLNIVSFIMLLCVAGIALEVYKATHPEPCPRCGGRDDDPPSGHRSKPITTALKSGSIFPPAE